LRHSLKHEYPAAVHGASHDVCAGSGRAAPVRLSQHRVDHRRL